MKSASPVRLDAEYERGARHHGDELTLPLDGGNTVGKFSDSKLDPRFRAVEAAPDPELDLSTSGGAGGSFVSGWLSCLCSPGAGDDIAPASWNGQPVRMLDDTYLVQTTIDVLRSIAHSPDVVYVEAPRPADIDLVPLPRPRPIRTGPLREGL
jgi:hypothetical protein